MASGPGLDPIARFISVHDPAQLPREHLSDVLQNLLAERFKMAFHDEADADVHELVVMKNRPKFIWRGQVADGDALRLSGPSKTDANGFPVL